MQQIIGQTFDHYRILNLLGEGGMGAVYKARDLTLQRDVAIKVMHAQFARQADFRERFLQEARTAARLKHTGIVQVHDFGQEQDSLYIVMEFIPGANLHQLRQDLKAQGKSIILTEAILLVRQVCLALDYAHRQGILHRDIKPSNIMLEPEPGDELPYRPVITDLGLAKLAEGGLVTREGASMGTPAYMSPEQALGKTTDARSDVYSLGILLYELAVGRLPFQIKTITEAIRCHTQEPPPVPRSIRADIPETLEAVILKALQKNPAQRFPDAASLAEALKGLAPAVTAIVAASIAPESTMSLMTQYQQSLVAERGPSILEAFPDMPSAELDRDRIQILEQDRTTRSLAMKPDGMTIGRGDDCDIVIDSPKVSRHHAKIEFDGTNYRIQDLNSTNGTFLANAKLLPGVPEVWTPEAALRIGDSWLRLARTGQVTSASILRSDGTIIDPSLVHSSVGEGRVGVYMENAQFNVEPGSSTIASLILLNQGTVVEHFKVSVTGIPANWIPAPPPPTHLMPGQQQEVTLSIQPPRAPQSRAGRYPIGVRVSSQAAPDQVAEVKATLTVTAYAQFDSGLYPQKIRAGQPARITINNQGNAQETFTLNWRDRGDEIDFRPPQTQLQIPEGQSAATEFRAQPRNRRLIGGQQTHPFTAQVIPAESQPQTHSGEIVSRGLIPLWLPPIVIFLCIVLASVAGLFYNSRLSQDRLATQTAVAAETMLAQNWQATSQAATQIAERLANANQATLDAVTATAVWMGADDDKDGLTNEREMELGTLPGKRDTDEDGLSDGDEVERGTDPLDDDTDGDGWNDGKEISEGTDPLDTDTDNDGIPDNKDSVPDRASTNTPTPTFTPTPSPTEDIWEITSFTVDEETTAYEISLIGPWIEPDSASTAWVNSYVSAYLDGEKASFIDSHQGGVSDGMSPGFLNLTYSTASAISFNSATDPYGERSHTTDLVNNEATLNYGHPVLSYRFDLHLYISGAAHPNTYWHALNFDLDNQRVMELPELFRAGADYLSVVASACVDDFARNGLPVSEGDLWLSPSLDSFRVWNLTPNGLLFSFSQCEVYPCVMGPVQCLVVYSDLAEILNPDGPLMDLYHP